MGKSSSSAPSAPTASGSSTNLGYPGYPSVAGFGNNGAGLSSPLAGYGTTSNSVSTNYGSPFSLSGMFGNYFNSNFIPLSSASYMSPTSSAASPITAGAASPYSPTNPIPTSQLPAAPAATAPTIPSSPPPQAAAPAAAAPATPATIGSTGMTQAQLNSFIQGAGQGMSYNQAAGMTAQQLQAIQNMANNPSQGLLQTG